MKLCTLFYKYCSYTEFAVVVQTQICNHLKVVTTLQGVSYKMYRTFIKLNIFVFKLHANVFILLSYEKSCSYVHAFCAQSGLNLGSAFSRSPCRMTKR